MEDSRREFLKLSLFSGASFFFLKDVQAHSNVKKFVNNSQAAFLVFPTKDGTTIDTRKDGDFRIVNFKSGEKTSFKPEGNGHSFLQHSLRPKSILQIPKRSGDILEIDSETKKVVNKIKSQEGYSFWGHAAFVGDKLFAGEIDHKDKESGMISVYSANDYKLETRFDSFGFIHECKKDSSSNELITAGLLKVNDPVISKKYRSSLRWFNLKNYTLTKQVYCPDDFSTLAHFEQSNKGRIITSAFYKTTQNEGPGLVYFGNEGDDVLKRGNAPSNIEKLFIGQAVSIAANFEKNIALVTHPTASIISFWDLNNGSFIKHLKLNYPIGAACSSDKKYFICSTFKEIVFIDQDSLKVVAEMPHGGESVSSHVNLIT